MTVKDLIIELLEYHSSAKVGVETVSSWEWVTNVHGLSRNSNTGEFEVVLLNLEKEVRVDKNYTEEF